MRVVHTRAPSGQAAGRNGWQYWLAVLRATNLSICNKKTWAASSVVEHLTFNQGVDGSIPSRPTPLLSVSYRNSQPHTAGSWAARVTTMSPYGARRVTASPCRPCPALPPPSQPHVAAAARGVPGTGSWFTNRPDSEGFLDAAGDRLRLRLAEVHVPDVVGHIIGWPAELIGEVGNEPPFPIK